MYRGGGGKECIGMGVDVRFRGGPHEGPVTVVVACTWLQAMVRS